MKYTIEEEYLNLTKELIDKSLDNLTHLYGSELPISTRSILASTMIRLKQAYNKLDEHATNEPIRRMFITTKS
tara:strand:- start:225 stop:443 length:219 start_codon:yes stop_codon:yes gene_type:complete